MTEHGRRMFGFAGSQAWNRLPLEVRQLQRNSFNSHRIVQNPFHHAVNAVGGTVYLYFNL